MVMIDSTNIRVRLFAFILASVIVLGTRSYSFAGQQKQEDGQTDFFDMSIEELMEVPVVVSASRQEQKVTETSVPISIITAEDIHYSGLTSIPEILQFACGMDVLQVDRNRYSVGVRGMHDVHSEHMQTLIDGRVADSAIFGGPNGSDSLS
jgi:iron complex outermembrane receptor protein